MLCVYVNVAVTVMVLRLANLETIYKDMAQSLSSRLL